MIGVDSSIIVDILRKNASMNLLKEYSSEDLCTSEIVVYELTSGIHQSVNNQDRKLKELNAILDTFGQIFSIDRRASLKAAEITGKLVRAGKMIGDADVLIAGSMIANGCVRFLTKNKKDFERISELKLV